MGSLHQETPRSSQQPGLGQPLPGTADVEPTDIQAAPATTHTLQGLPHPQPLPELQQLETGEESLPKLTLPLKLQGGTHTGPEAGGRGEEGQLRLNTCAPGQADQRGSWCCSLDTKSSPWLKPSPSFPRELSFR